MSGPRTRPLAWLLERSASCFVPVIRRSCAADDPPADPARFFRLGRRSFGHIVWPDGRWLVLPIDHRLAPTPEGGMP